MSDFGFTSCSLIFNSNQFFTCLASRVRRWTKTATISRLTPGRDYRAFVRAVSLAGNGHLFEMEAETGVFQCSFCREILSQFLIVR